MIPFKTPDLFPYLPALVVLIYSISLKKTASTVVETVLKCIAGYYLIGIGGAITAAALSPVNDLLMASYGIHAGVLNTESFSAVLLMTRGNEAIAAFFLAFFTNLILARLLKKGYMFLTCHHLLFLSLLAVVIIDSHSSLPLPLVILTSGVLTGLFVYIVTALSARPMRLLSPSHAAALSNSANTAGLLADIIGRKCRRHKENAYGKGGRSQLSVFSVGSITLFLLYTFLYWHTHALEAGRLSYALTQSVLFGASVSILMLGIRMLLSPLTAMLWDISRKTLPTLIAGLDATAIITYSPMAWNVGFFTASLSGTMVSLICLQMKVFFVPLPGITSLYFAGGVAGVIGNAAGGKRGAIASGLFIGAFVMLLCSVFMTHAGIPLGDGIAPGETAYGIFGCILLGLCRLLP